MEIRLWEVPKGMDRAQEGSPNGSTEMGHRGIPKGMDRRQGGGPQTAAWR